jgi:bacteriocin biosynthesis cyclodehydratase domain-containing protein
MTTSTRVTLNPHLRVIHTGENEILVKESPRSLSSKVISDETRSGLLGKLLRHLVSSAASLEELKQRGVLTDKEMEDAIELTDYLQREGVIIDAEADPVLIYLDTLLKGNSNKLAASTIGILGAGSLGSRIALEVASLRPNQILVQDDNELKEPSIDNRYFPLSPTVIAAEKPCVNAVKEHLEQANYQAVVPINASVWDKAKVQTLFEQADFVIVALDHFSSKTLHTANQAALVSQKPWLSLWNDGAEGHIGPIYIPGQTGCYADMEAQQEAAARSIRNEYLIYKEALDDEQFQHLHLTLPPYAQIAAGFAIMGFVHFMATGRSFLVEHCLRMDFANPGWDFQKALKLPRCPACDADRPFRHLFL